MLIIDRLPLPARPWPFTGPGLHHPHRCVWRAALFALLALCLSWGPGCKNAEASGEDAGADAEAGSTTVIVIRNAGPGAAYLDGSYRPWCQTLFGLHRADTGDRLLLPNAALCRCDACELTACGGMVSWWHFYIALPEGSEVRYTWDHRYLAEPVPPESCGDTGCFGWRQAAPGEHEVRVSYSRQTPVCAFGEETSGTGDFLSPPGLELPAEAELRQCVAEDSNQCALVPLSTSARFDRDATAMELVLQD